MDGYGNVLKMDDANTPSLLSLPLLRFVSRQDPIYLKTREYILSEKNPYYYQGKLGKGIGSPHVDANENKVWPISLIV